MTAGRPDRHTPGAFSYACTPSILSPMSERGAVRLAWSACVVSLLVVGGGIALHVLNRTAPGVDRNGWWGSAAAGAIGFAISGALVASRHRSNPIGWIFLGLAVAGGVDVLALEYGIYALGSHPGSLAGGTVALWVASWIWTFSALLFVVFLLFPDGRLPSRRWRPVLALAISLPALYVLGHAVYAGPIREPRNESFPSVENPLGIPAAKHILTILGDILLPFVFATILACLAALVVRFRRAQFVARQQIKWVAYAGALVVAQVIVGPFIDLRVWQVVNPVAIVLFTAALGIALVRYRLYDIDLIVNRTLVYAALSACLIGAYAGTVALLGELVRHVGFLGPLLATGLVAVLFAPLRLRLQRGVDRLLYGQRRDPYEVIAQLGERLEETPEPGHVLPTLVETVARALKLPYAAIELRRADESFEPVASFGSLIGEPLRLPLAYQNAPVGRLVLGPRRAGGRFSRSELRLFEDIARQAGIAAYAVQLTTDLQRSRGRLVSAREEERRRLRRDLHDELGPQLAGVGLQLEAARALVRADPAAAEAMLERLARETRSAIAAIRRLAYELRPPALDELGLAGALRQQADRFSSGNGGSRRTLSVSVNAPDEVDQLPAAVEAAAYRIALEALTNAARHADARTCTVSIRHNGVLELEVLDDGRGFPPERVPGVGLRSMHERAAELGGTFAIGPGPAGGTLVRARLPVAEG